MSQGDEHRRAAPVNPLPPVVWALALPMIVLECVLQLADRGLIGGVTGVGWRLAALSRMAFVPEQLMWMVQTGQYPAAGLSRLLAYAFIHTGFGHAAFVVVFVLALGKHVGEVFRPLALALLFLGATVGAALIYTLMLALLPGLHQGGAMMPLVGGYPGAFGLIGAFTFILWLRLGAAGGEGWRAFGLIGVLMGIRLLFGLMFGGGPDWVADLAGFGIGFVLSFLLVPGGPARLLAWLRTR